MEQKIDVLNGKLIYAILNKNSANDVFGFVSIISWLQTQSYGIIRTSLYKEAVMESV